MAPARPLRLLWRRQTRWRLGVRCYGDTKQDGARGPVAMVTLNKMAAADPSGRLLWRRQTRWRALPPRSSSEADSSPAPSPPSLPFPSVRLSGFVPAPSPRPCLPRVPASGWSRVLLSLMEKGWSLRANRPLPAVSQAKADAEVCAARPWLFPTFPTAPPARFPPPGLLQEFPRTLSLFLSPLLAPPA